MRFPGNMVIFPWIRRREPIADILRQLVTCHTITVISARNGNVKANSRFTCSYRPQLHVGFLPFGLRQKCLDVANKTYRELPGHHQSMPCRLEESIIQRGQNTCRMRLLTLHNHSHILDKTVDDLKSLRCGSASLIVRESIQPLEDRLDFLLSESFLYKFDCILLSNLTCLRERTHLIALV
jgi:hypothetical protein